jgi:hypothetical protein
MPSDAIAVWAWKPTFHMPIRAQGEQRIDHLVDGFELFEAAAAREQRFDAVEELAQWSHQPFTSISFRFMRR